MECPVCRNTYTKSVRKPVECRHCHASACQACYRTYLMGTLQVSHCLHCKTAWTNQEASVHFSKAWWDGDYAKQRALLRLQQEKNLIPETVAQIEREQLRRALASYAKEITHIGSRLHQNVVNLVPSPNQTGWSSYARLNQLKTVIDEFVTAKHEFDALCFPGFVDGPQPTQTVSVSVKAEECSVALPCPKEGCRGFTNRVGRCALCDTKVCTKCRAVKADEHTCVPEDIATVDLLKKDCRHCPQCRVLIHRYEGCPQMWCTHCHTGFDWNTGTILKTLHNPHLTEWLAQNGGAGVPRVVCDINLRALSECVPISDQAMLLSLVDHALHFQRHTLRAYQTALRNADDYTSLRRSYVLRSLSENEWAREIRLLQKRETLYVDAVQVAEMFTQVSLGVFQQVVEGTASWSNAKTMLLDVLKSKNDRLTELNRRYCVKLFAKDCMRPAYLQPVTASAPPS